MANGGDCPEELEKQCCHSPGPVIPGERVSRTITSNDIDAETGEVSPRAFPVRDLMERGFSLDRLAHIDQPRLAERAKALAEQAPGRTLKGVMVANVNSIRAFRDSADRQALCVLDAGQADNAAHAIAIRSGTQSKGEIRGMRDALLKLFAPLVSVADAYRA